MDLFLLKAPNISKPSHISQWESYGSIQELWSQHKHKWLHQVSYVDTFDDACNTYPSYFDAIIGMFDSFIDLGIVTPSNTIQHCNCITALVAKTYNETVCDVGEPVTPLPVNDVMQWYSCIVMDESAVLIFDTGTSKSITFDSTDFVGPIRPPSSQTLAHLSEKTQVRWEGKVQWRLCDDYGQVQGSNLPLAHLEHDEEKCGAHPAVIDPVIAEGNINLTSHEK
eukprot:9440565-Ditylum_brightwellii.AAC.1